nr:FAD-dependent monooxygenase [Microvirga massiliensis]
MIERSREEVLIVGGGPAGSAAACMLGARGRIPLLIEREAAPHDKVCGEFLSAEAQQYLDDLGVDLEAMGASRIVSVRLFHDNKKAQCDLPFTARGLSRRTLDEALLERALTENCRIDRGVRVRTIEPSPGGMSATTDGDHRIEAGTLFLATGKHDVRGVNRPRCGTLNDLIGFKSYVVLKSSQQSALDGAVEIHLFPGGYAGLQMIDGGRAGLCLVVSRGRFEQIGKTWPTLLAYLWVTCPVLEERLEGSVGLADRPLSVFQVPYGFLHRPGPSDPDGLFRIGDQVGVIPSFTGNGVAIALHTGTLAATVLLQSGTSRLFHKIVRSDIRVSISLASFLNRVNRWPGGQRVLISTCQSWPSAMGLLTSLTRVAPRTVMLTRAIAGRSLNDGQGSGAKPPS